MNLQQRIDNHLAEYPNSVAGLSKDKGKMYLTWIMGNNYTSKSKSYGELPHSLLRRIKSLFPDCQDQNILHLFSGPINEGITFDIKKELNPTICDDVRNIKNYADILANVDLVIADPPYDRSDFDKCQVPHLTNGR